MIEKISHFTDLIVWKEAHAMILVIYAITKKYPSDEKFSLSNQMRRAAISITSNIAEGFGRLGKKDKAQFYLIARGSLIELENQLIISKDLKYLNVNDFKSIESNVMSVHRLLNGLIKATINNKHVH
ncbi:MAG: four helix bundle protein [Candidatus Roizmanbacteria bacterium]|uniref:Four helix bundle protein n=1 Tax=Candidatus Roizmanbacteria bacterium CG_4_9_14_0_2_um_filter_39_13 TaxID=1974839 RepID=A0A2M8EWP7_9BACT|nr:four helix bundle protein [Candidatus Roizmanbacteria bacterium]PJC30292.1 MAG: four helix bundle protein [Candidatus Roizmanbacteria bacterium CG_4_9_14_0_2_um_filter_39_13]